MGLSDASPSPTYSDSYLGGNGRSGVPRGGLDGFSQGGRAANGSRLTPETQFDEDWHQEFAVPIKALPKTSPAFSPAQPAQNAAAPSTTKT